MITVHKFHDKELSDLEAQISSIEDDVTEADSKVIEADVTSRNIIEILKTLTSGNSDQEFGKTIDLVLLKQSEYNNLVGRNSNTLYCITTLDTSGPEDPSLAVSNYVYIGNKKSYKFYVGNNIIHKVYQGDNIIYKDSE